jgi:putative spermidine/putrescine transport system ATP-binding protein
MAKLDIKSVSKLFGTTRAVDDFSLTVEDGELVCLLGPSGSGKSTLLRMVGGFERPTSGSITIDGEEIAHLPPEKRPTGMVFQSHALWTHMNVFKNIAFGLKLRRLPRDEIERKVEAVLDLVGLKGYGQRLTHQLSGGQQQRVALARSLVLEPKILLLDEPFASLDQHLRERLREEVRDIQQRLRITTLFVTHGQDEALALADRIVVMRDGRTEQIARPAEVYRDPATPFVAGFIGQMNLVSGAVRDGHFVHSALRLPAPVADGPAILAVRPEALAIRPAEAAGSAHVHRLIDYGTHAMIDVELPDGERLKSMMPTADGWTPLQPIDLVPGEYALYRDDAVIFRSAPGGLSGSASLSPAQQRMAVNV